MPTSNTSWTLGIFRTTPVDINYGKRKKTSAGWITLLSIPQCAPRATNLNPCWPRCGSASVPTATPWIALGPGRNRGARMWLWGAWWPRARRDPSSVLLHIFDPASSMGYFCLTASTEDCHDGFHTEASGGHMLTSVVETSREFMANVAHLLLQNIRRLMDWSNVKSFVLGDGHATET
eukprot:m.230900 g.230900  ORF g.230900 m.230900 type:complete len:178 (+) comp19263_c0_seq6:1979-2512(+)